MSDIPKEAPASDLTQVISREMLEEIKSIPIVCPWCNRLYSVARWKVELNRRTAVSHGICPDCYKKVKRNAKAAKTVKPAKGI